MDVTRSNFLQMLPLIEDAVANCDFLSIDEELSGLRKGRGGDMFDLQGERYRKMRDACMGYSIIQFGLSCFRKNPDLVNGCPSYQCHIFNVFIFPYKVIGLPRFLERNVEMQASAVYFLRSHGFDFNRLFDEGISYLTMKEEDECRKAFRDNEERNSQHFTQVPDDLRDFIKQCLDQVDNFLSQTPDLDANKDQEDANDYKGHRLDLPPCNAFKRKLLYGALSGQKYQNRISITSLPVSPASKDIFLSIKKSNPAAKQQRNQEILTEAAGFTRILQLISKHKKPLVGHNLFLDIMHVVRQFLTSDLPGTYDEFKDLVHSMFPVLYDTKYIASTLALKKLITSTALEDVYKIVCAEPFGNIHVQHVEQDSRAQCMANHTDLEGSKHNYHQAGYDSYITGFCFIKMNNYLQAVLGDGSSKDNCVIGPEIQRYVNRLNLTFSFDLDHFYVGGEEIRPNRDHVYHVSFPVEWNTHSLTQLFAPYGAIQINWINDTSAFVGLKDAANARSLNKSITGTGRPDSGVQITPYYHFSIRKEEEVTSNNRSKRSVDQVAEEVKAVSFTLPVAAGISEERKKLRSAPQHHTESSSPDSIKHSSKSCEATTQPKNRLHPASAAKVTQETPFAEENDW